MAEKYPTTRGKKHMCSICDYTTDSVWNLRRHIATKHGGKLPTTCHHCPYVSTRADNMKRHIKRCHPDQNSAETWDSIGTEVPLNQPPLDSGPINQSVQSNDKPALQCNYCDYAPTEHWLLKRHMENTHGNGQTQFSCTMCEYTAARRDQLNEHMKKHTVHDPARASTSGLSNQGDSNKQQTSSSDESSSENDTDKPTGDSTKKYKCDLCPYKTNNNFVFKRHQRTVHQANSFHRCDECDSRFKRKDHLYVHRKKVHGAHPSNYRPPVQPTPNRFRPSERMRTRRDDAFSLRDPSEPTDAIIHTYRPDIQTLVRQKWSSIRTRLCRFEHRSEYLVRLDNTNMDYIRGLLEMIHSEQQTQYKANIAFGSILRHTAMETLRYFHPAFNNVIRDRPMLIQNENDLTTLLSVIEETDLLEHAKKERPTSGYVPVAIVNMLVTIYPLSDTPIGNIEHDLPKFIRKNRAIQCLAKDAKRGNYFLDDLCFFRCLALKYGHSSKKLEKSTKALFRQYCEVSNRDPQTFHGVCMYDLRELEDIFKIAINVYSIEEGGTATLQRMSTIRNVSEKLYLNLWEDHFSYIKDFDKYAKSHKCRVCTSTFPTAWRCKRHEKTCSGLTKLIFPGGTFKPTKSVFDDLAMLGIHVEDRYYKFRAGFDIECLFDDEEKREDTETINWLNKHEVMSIAIASNVPGMEAAECYISEGDPKALTETFVAHLERISSRAKDLMMAQYASTLEQLDDLLKSQSEELQAVSTPDQKENPADILDGDEEPENKKPYIRPPVAAVKNRFMNWLSQLVVYGFNSGKYDVPAMKSCFFPALMKQCDLGFVVKKLNNYMCISSSSLRIIDVCNFLAPGTSLSRFLKAFKVPEQKGFYPYELMRDLKVLDIDHLPPKEAFYSKLKKSHISDEDYEFCQNIWKEKDMKTMRDFLHWYNIQDILPMLKALEGMTDYFKSRGLDLGKDGISLPGLALKDLFQNIDTFFSIPYTKDEDMYHLMKSNIVGGPSLIFHRWHEVGKTFIRGNPDKPCKKIVGEDSNALYLGCIMDYMPSGFYCRRKEETGFCAEKTHKYGRLAREWLTWYGKSNNVDVMHQFRNGQEFRVGARNIPVDGYIRTEKMVLQMHGCIFHGHGCALTVDKHGEQLLRCPINNELMTDLRRNTESTTQYIRAQGYQVKEMWECQWKQLKRSNPDIQGYITEKFDTWTTQNRGPISEDGLIEAIRNGDLFGLVECSIEVPEEDREFWSEMPPIFVNKLVGRDDLSPLMRKYAEEHDLLKQPRRMLIGSMKGEKILLATPLLQFYLKNNLKITRIYQTIEYEPRDCFRKVGQRVCDSRRAGDADPDMGIIAEMEKLTGNCYYGRTATDQQAFKQVQYFNKNQQKKELNRAVCHQSFIDVLDLDDEYVELTRAPKSTKIDLPLQIAFFVYSLAKLRMLSFYKDFMLEYINREDFQYVAMDTDSAYIAFAAEDWKDLIKPEMREQFEREKGKWFPRDCCDKHAAYDRRTPLLFKEEWRGNGFVGLCSKTYFCYNGDSDNKHSCKGLQKARNAFNQEQFLEVLRSGKSGSGQNSGFRTIGSHVYTYEQNKCGLTYFYPKRWVEDDGITTTYIDK